MLNMCVERKSTVMDDSQAPYFGGREGLWSCHWLLRGEESSLSTS